VAGHKIYGQTVWDFCPTVHKSKQIFAICVRCSNKQNDVLAWSRLVDNLETWSQNHCTHPQWYVCVAQDCQDPTNRPSVWQCDPRILLHLPIVESVDQTTCDCCLRWWLWSPRNQHVVRDREVLDRQWGLGYKFCCQLVPVVQEFQWFQLEENQNRSVWSHVIVVQTLVAVWYCPWTLSWCQDQS